MRSLIMVRWNGGIATALFHDGKAAELSFEKDEPAVLPGNIYIGKVANIVKNIQAAFVEIEGGIPCYYSLEEKSPVFVNRQSAKGLAAGDELLVQVSREGVKTKAPTVTSNICLSGKYLVLTSGKKQIGVSAKLTGEERARLFTLLEPLANERFGWIARTNAAKASGEDILAEAARLRAQFLTLCEKAPHCPCRSCLYRNPPQYLGRLKDLYSSEYEQILTDDAALFVKIREYLSVFQPKDAAKLSFYQDKLLPLYRLYPLEKAFEEALSQRVWLGSGAYLVIQPTEALTAIDVNTGKCERGKKAEETFLKINLEAAQEIARQLRLRNLSGMILIDFINLKEKTHQELLMKALGAALQKDPVKACVVDMTALGLVEVTRKRVQKSLAEKLGK